MVHQFFADSVEIDINKRPEDAYTYVTVYDKELSFVDNLDRYKSLDEYSDKKETPWLFLIGG